jgi:hypothetical protein
MGRLKLPTGIEEVSGQISFKPNKKTDQHWKHKDVMLAKHRKAATTSDNCQSLFFVSGEEWYKRNTPVTAREMQARTRFAAVRQAVWDRAHDLNSISADQAAFLAQKDTAGGKKTMNSYLWKLEGEAYDANH